MAQKQEKAEEVKEDGHLMTNILPHTISAEAKRVLASQSDSDDSEKQYLLEYYSLVREGKTNYISTLAFHDITGTHPQELPDFFKSYEQEFRPHHHHTPNKKRKIDGK